MIKIITAEIILTIINSIEYYYYISESTVIKDVTLSISKEVYLGEEDHYFLSNKYNIVELSELSNCARVDSGLLIVVKSIRYINDTTNILVKIDFATKDPNIFGKAEFEFMFKNNFWSLQRRQLFSTSIGK